MKLLFKNKVNFIAILLLLSCGIKDDNPPDISFDFNGTIYNDEYQFKTQSPSFVKGIDGEALIIDASSDDKTLVLDQLSLDGTKDFSIQCWIKTTSRNPMVFISQKDFINKGIIAQKNAGWALYSSGGTFGFSIGSGKRRINYERDNGEKMPINDGEWHQMTITFSKENSELRLYYDGYNKAIYKVNFEFTNSNPIVVGINENDFDYNHNYSPEIESGKENLQALVEEFNAIGLEPLKNEEFLHLITNPDQLFTNKLAKQKLKNKPNKEILTKVHELRGQLDPNPYTAYQNMKLTVLKPINKIFSLNDGKVIIDETAGRSFTMDEKLYDSDFTIDELSIWKTAISAVDVLNDYKKFKKANTFKLTNKLKKFNVGVWNIWHGGIHWTLEKDGWDSRMRIVEMIKEKKLDVILMQETYSGGDFIAAELGYYYATTSDWDYKFQGSNISVLSRYPITEVKVAEETEFNNVAVKLAISETQNVWAMSNWYGMNNFQKVYEFNKSRFDNSEEIPVFFGGDFNAVPHTDGGKSPASIKMMEDGFIDAFRSLYPDVKIHPGFSHIGNVRIDQLYYKGKGLKNNFTEVISKWPTGFPSDHYLIVSKFELN